MPFQLLWLSLGCCLALSWHTAPSFAQSDPPLPPETGIDIPVNPAAEAPPQAEADNAIATELNRTVIEILTQGMEQAIKGEEVEISPTVVTGIAAAIATQLEQASQQQDAPQGISEMAQAVRVAVDGGSEAEVVTAVRDALTILIGNIPTPSPTE